MQCDVRADQSRADIQGLNFTAKHDDAAWMSIVASVTVLKSVGAFGYEASVFVSRRFDLYESDGIVEELHLLYISPARGQPLWEDGDAQADDGLQIEADWDQATQPSPDFDVDQRVNW